MDSRLNTTNTFYAIRIDDTFDYVKTRGVPIQSKPYPTLVEAVEDQKIFEFHNITETIVGFRCPVYINGVNVPGYHMHFPTSNRSTGGHLLDLELNNAISRLTTSTILKWPCQQRRVQQCRPVR
jgi:acetolactate decarboxylase